ncbi:MAG: GDSL-type esterase/lipase family protein [Victivallales bacterium]
MKKCYMTASHEVLKRHAVYFLTVLLCLSFAPLHAGEDGRCFLRDGDRWLILGDSITNNGTYVRMVRRMLNHFHPGSDIEINGTGIDGITSNHAFSKENHNSSVVSIMLGTNDAIHRGYDKVDRQKVLDAYRQGMLKTVRLHQDNGSIVLLLSSPLVDENFGRGWWELRNSNELLREFPQILQEIAKETGAYYIPVQEEMEAYRVRLQKTFGIVRPLYPDGVHPNGWAQYQIAKTLWEHLNVSGQLPQKGEERRLAPAFKPVSVEVSLCTKFSERGNPIKLRLKSSEPVSVSLGWSYGNLRGRTNLPLTPEGMEWTVPLEEEDLDVKTGQNRTLVFDLVSGDDRSIHILDITGTRVWHLNQEKAVDGDIPIDGIPKHGTWKISKYENGLLLSGTVIDKDIRDAEHFTSRGGVHVMLDLRQEPRFADLSFDEDVHFLCLTVQEKPQFGIGISPSWGRGLGFAGSGGAQKTAGGYGWHFYISHGFKDRDKSFDVGKSDFIGFNIDIVDTDVDGNGKSSTEWVRFTKTDYEVQNFPGFLQILDMKNKLKGDEVLVLNLWGL